MNCSGSETFSTRNARILDTAIYARVLVLHLFQSQDQELAHFVANFIEQYTAEYTGMAILHSVDRLQNSSLGEWVVVQGSVSGEGKDVDIYKICTTYPGEPDAVRLTDETNHAGWPAWSPDGSRIAYTSSNDLMVVNADRSRVTWLAGRFFGTPIWRSNANQ